MWFLAYLCPCWQLLLNDSILHRRPNLLWEIQMLRLTGSWSACLVLSKVNGLITVRCCIARTRKQDCSVMFIFLLLLRRQQQKAKGDCSGRVVRWGAEKGVQDSARAKLEGSMGQGECLQTLHHPAFWLEAGKTESMKKDCIWERQK